MPRLGSASAVAVGPPGLARRRYLLRCKSGVRGDGTEEVLRLTTGKVAALSTHPTARSGMGDVMGASLPLHAEAVRAVGGVGVGGDIASAETSSSRTFRFHPRPSGQTDKDSGRPLQGT